MNQSIKTITNDDVSPPLPDHRQKQVDAGLMVFQQTIHDLDLCREDLRKAKLEIQMLQVELRGQKELYEDLTKNNTRLQLLAEDAMNERNYMESVFRHLRRYMDDLDQPRTPLRGTQAPPPNGGIVQEEVRHEDAAENDEVRQQGGRHHQTAGEYQK